MRYLFGWRASSTMAAGWGGLKSQLSRKEPRQHDHRHSDARMTLVRFLAMLTRSRPDRCENSTA
jgi:hypothetical protein